MLVTLFTCYDIACKGSGIQAIDKATEVLSIMVVCEHSFHNGVMDTYGTNWWKYHAQNFCGMGCFYGSNILAYFMLDDGFLPYNMDILKLDMASETLSFTELNLS